MGFCGLFWVLMGSKELKWAIWAFKAFVKNPGKKIFGGWKIPPSLAKKLIILSRITSSLQWFFSSAVVLFSHVFI